MSKNYLDTKWLERVEAALEAGLPEHPRLFAPTGGWKSVRAAAGEAGATERRLRARVAADARALLDLPLLERKQIGRRLLSVSREALRRIAALALAYRLEGDEALLRRCLEEMDRVAGFSDWNPSHFLDTAEMAAALAIGYDWLHDVLPEGLRGRVRAALAEKALAIGTDWEDPRAGFVRMTNNWNQVCHGGLALAALAVAEEERPVAARMLAQARQQVENSMRLYEPDGCYPEGGSYYEYGTTYNCLLLDAFRGSFGAAGDFGLLEAFPGFARSPAYRTAVAAPSGAYWNYGDCGLRAAASLPILWLGSDAEAREQRDALDEGLRGEEGLGESERFLAMAFLWLLRRKLWRGETAPPRRPLVYAGRGVNPVAALRTAWGDRRALFAGLKGGLAATSHGQMDAGAFVVEADGVRWAVEVAKKSYHHFEERGHRFFDRRPQGDRWRFLVCNHQGHSVPEVNGEAPALEPSAPLEGVSRRPDFLAAAADLSGPYRRWVGSLRRGLAIVDGARFALRDECAGAAAGALFRWSWMTFAEVRVVEGGFELRQDGERLDVAVRCDGEGLELGVEAADPPPHPDEPPNPGLKRLTVRLAVPEGGAFHLSAVAVPGGLGAAAPAFPQPLEAWGLEADWG